MAVWALIYTLSSMALGWVLKRAFKFPAYTLPAIAFNNTTALPLLLIQSLETSGILDNLTMGGNDTASAAASRAKSYFLVSAMVGNSLTFAIGPKLLDDEEAPDKNFEEQRKQEEIAHANGRIETDEEHAEPVNCSRRTTEEQEEHVTEATTLLPDSLARPSGQVIGKVSGEAEHQWVKLPPYLRKSLKFAGSFLTTQSLLQPAVWWRHFQSVSSRSPSIPLLLHNMGSI
jgi:auxin efflux carrier family protein